MTRTMTRNDMIRPKFYLARRDTRWDPYPASQPLKAVAHDSHGFWELTRAGEWFKTPTSYNLSREITEVEALAHPRGEECVAGGWSK